MIQNLRKKAEVNLFIMDKKYLLTDPELLETFVIIEDLNFADNSILLKLENIGLYKGETIFLKRLTHNKNIILFQVNDVTYGIRVKDAAKILVKKVND